MIIFVEQKNEEKFRHIEGHQHNWIDYPFLLA
jgi:hypothetical protein